MCRCRRHLAAAALQRYGEVYAAKAFGVSRAEGIGLTGVPLDKLAHGGRIDTPAAGYTNRVRPSRPSVHRDAPFVSQDRLFDYGWTGT